MRLPVRYRSAAGVPRLSVTQVLTYAGRIETQWYTPEACRRGQAVHAWTEAWDAGRVAPLDDPSYVGYCEAYAAFTAEVKPVWAGIEQEVQSEAWQLAGRIDRVAAELVGRPGILDVKTGGPAAWHALQVAAYNAMRPTGLRWVLYLRANGTYRLERFDDATAYRVFFYEVARVHGMVLADGDHWMPR